MQRNLEDLEVVDLGDAKELTKGPYTTDTEEDSMDHIHKLHP